MNRNEQPIFLKAKAQPLFDNRSESQIEGQESVLATNKVLRNTYILLALTLLFTAMTAGLAMAVNMRPVSPWLVLIGYFALLFVTTALRNSVWGLVSVFALTGFMGLTLGPILNLYITFLSNGSQLIMTAFGTTAVVFLGLSVYTVTTRKDFSFMGGFLLSGILAGFVLALVAMFFQIPALALAVSAIFVLLMSAMILYETSNIIHGGETNYIMATITLYVAIYNLFTSLLHLLGFGFGEE